MDQADFMQKLRDEKGGFCCPCCGRWAQLYRRRLHATVARQLIELYRLGSKEARAFVHASMLIPKGQAGSGDLGKAAYWDLIEQKPPTPDSPSKASGYWRLTISGLHFVLGVGKINEVALVFDDRVHSYEGALIGIKESLGIAFDYSALMRGD